MTERPEQPDVLASADAGGRAIRGGVMRVAGYGAGLLAALLSAPFLIRHLGVGDFGRYVTVVSLLTLVSVVADAGLTVVGVREYAIRDAEGRSRLMRNLIALRVVLSAAGAACAVAFAAVAGYGSELVAGTALGGLGMVLIAVQQTFLVPLQGDLRLGMVTTLDFGRQALSALVIVAAVVAGATLVTFLAIPIAVGAALLVTTVAVARGRRWRPSLDGTEWRFLMRETLPVAIASTVGSFFYRIAIIVMSLIATEQATGWFSASFRIGEVIIAVPGLVTAAAFPILAHAAHTDGERLAYAMQRLFEIALILGGLTMIGVVFGARPAIGIIAGDDFAPSVPVLRLQAVGLGVSFLVAVWATGLWSLRRQKAVAWANALGVAVSGGLVALLVPEAGASGAAVAMSAAEVVLAATYLLALTRGRRDLVPSVAILPRVVLAAAAAGAVWFVPAPDGVLTIVACGVYLAVLVAVRGVPREIREAFRPPAAIPA